MPSTPSKESVLRGFDQSLPMTLLKAREVVMRRFIPSLRAHNLSPQQWRVLRMLAEIAEQDASQIADRCSILMPSLSRILANLEGRGLIARKTSELDQRRSLISITAKGRRLVDEIAPVSEERYDEIARRFGEKNLNELHDMLGRLIECLDK